MGGLFLGVYLLDSLILPATPDLFLGFLAVAKDVNHVLGVTLICIASVLGGFSGYFIGSHIKDWPFLEKFVYRYEDRGKELFRKYGIWGVVIGAMTPIPFSTVCWLAGMFEMNFKKFALACLFRIPRMIIWYVLIAYSWIKL